MSIERTPHWSPRASSDTVSCTFSYHTWQFIIFTIFTITTSIFSYSPSFSFWTQDLAFRQMFTSIDLFLSYRTDYTDLRPSNGFTLFKRWICLHGVFDSAGSYFVFERTLNHCTFISFHFISSQHSVLWCCHPRSSTFLFFFESQQPLLNTTQPFLNFLKNFANLSMMSPCHCHLIFQRFIIIIIIITTFTMHHSISVPLQTQNLPFFINPSHHSLPPSTFPKDHTDFYDHFRT